MAVVKVTREQAEAVLAEVKKQYASQIHGDHAPVLRQGNWEYLNNDTFSIDWEGGPESWAFEFKSEVPDIYVEACNSFAVAVCSTLNF